MAKMKYLNFSFYSCSIFLRRSYQVCIIVNTSEWLQIEYKNIADFYVLILNYISLI
jgi:hypothetical protein